MVLCSDFLHPRGIERDSRQVRSLHAQAYKERGVGASARATTAPLPSQHARTDVVVKGGAGSRRPPRNGDTAFGGVGRSILLSGEGPG